MISTTAPPIAPAAPGPAEAAVASASPVDFLAVLAQLAGAAVQASAPAPAEAAQAPLDESDGAEPSAESSQAALLFGVVAPSAPLNLAAEARASVDAEAPDMIAELQRAREPARGAPLTIEAGFAGELGFSQGPERTDASASPDGASVPAAARDLHGAPRAAAHVEAQLTRPVQTPVGGAAWADEIGSRLTLMAEHGKHTASLRLSPEHLGPLEIRIAIRDDQASVWFGAAHADTRAAIEHALPRLRELFESQGLSLADAGVFREPPRERTAAGAHASGSENEPLEEAPQSTAARRLLGLIDAYA